MTRLEERYQIPAWVLSGFALLFALWFGLLPALLAGLLVHELVRVFAPRLMQVGRLRGEHAKAWVVALLGLGVIAGLTLATLGTVHFFQSGTGNLPALLNKMAEILESSRALLPESLVAHLPSDVDDLKIQAAAWLRSHAGELQTIGKEAGRTIAHVLVGMILGAMVALREVGDGGELRPLASALIERAARLAEAFRQVVFAQAWIAAINALLTGIFLMVLLPFFGVHLPFAKTLIAITFLFGLLPVVGNIMSNTVIVIVSLSHSLEVAIGSLIFLMLIHKLEYFLNARIVGYRIRAAAWEILLAMLVMEAAFGIAGVVAAPIYYAYLKNELTQRQLI
jgi:predicted PurR-regulated permease PerM